MSSPFQSVPRCPLERGSVEKESDTVCGDGLVMSATDKDKDTKPRLWSIYSVEAQK